MDNIQSKLVPPPDTCDEERPNFCDLSNFHPTAQESSDASPIPESKEKDNLNDLISVASGIPHEIAQSWHNSIASLNNLFSDMTLQNSSTKSELEDDFEKEAIASKNETINEYPAPIIPILKQSAESDGIQHGMEKLTNQNANCKKQPILVNNRFTQCRKYKHTYFDSDGQEINGSNKTTTNVLHLSSSDESKVELPPMISTYFKGKSLIDYSNKKGKNKCQCQSKKPFLQLDTINHFKSWSSVVPKNVAEHIAKRCRSRVIIDGFCGTGENAIQFAMKCNKVIAIDSDPEKIKMAIHNATIYGVNNRIEFLIGNFLTLVDSLKANVIFLSPPWDGSDSSKKDVYDVETALTPVAASELMKISRKITQNIVIYLPRNSNIHQLAQLAGPERPVEIEKCSVDGELIAIAAYYGTLFIKQ